MNNEFDPTTLEPKPFFFWDANFGKLAYIYPDTKSYLSGWIIRQLKDGRWISLRKASEADMANMGHEIKRLESELAEVTDSLKDEMALSEFAEPVSLAVFVESLEAQKESLSEKCTAKDREILALQEGQEQLRRELAEKEQEWFAVLCLLNAVTTEGTRKALQPQFDKANAMLAEAQKDNYKYLLAASKGLVALGRIRQTSEDYGMPEVALMAGEAIRDIDAALKGGQDTEAVKAANNFKQRMKNEVIPEIQEAIHERNKAAAKNRDSVLKGGQDA